MNPVQYLKDYYSNSPNDSIVDQLKNFGLEAGGGKAALNGIITGISAPIKTVADAYTIGSNKAIGALTGKDMTSKINKQLNDSNNFFSNDSLQESVNENPIINSLANYGTTLAGGAALTKAPLKVLDNYTSQSVIDSYRQQNKPLSINSVGTSIVNGLGNVVKQPIKAVNYGINSLVGNLTNTNRAANIKNDARSIDNFFHYGD